MLTWKFALCVVRYVRRPSAPTLGSAGEDRVAQPRQQLWWVFVGVMCWESLLVTFTVQFCLSSWEKSMGRMGYGKHNHLRFADEWVLWWFITYMHILIGVEEFCVCVCVCVCVCECVCVCVCVCLLPEAGTGLSKNSVPYTLASKWHATLKQDVHVPAVQGSRSSLLLECWTRDQKILSSNFSRSGRRIFFSSVNFVCWLVFGVRSTPCYCGGTWKTMVFLPKVQLAGYT